MALPLLVWAAGAIVTAGTAYVAKEYFSDSSSSSSDDDSAYQAKAERQRQVQAKKEAQQYAQNAVSALARKYGVGAHAIGEHFYESDADGYPQVNARKLAQAIAQHSVRHKKLKHHAHEAARILAAYSER